MTRLVAAKEGSKDLDNMGGGGGDIVKQSQLKKKKVGWNWTNLSTFAMNQNWMIPHVWKQQSRDEAFRCIQLYS
jgi:hypothetical protein